ncbi:MAG: hypothetical protein WCK09_13470 [Bacteroidota bacterium]
MEKALSYFKQNAVFILLAAYILAGVLTIIFFDGTGDDGDSIAHYFFSRYAPVHPVLYLNHWAKPLFVIISSPFAQFGFNGMKFFNLCVSLLSFYLTFLTAERLSIRNPLLVIVFLIFTPLYYVLTFSGLTEPLFALFLIGAIYLILQKAWIPAALVVSLMPFVRSEGLIFIMVFGLYFIFTNKWKYLPWLLTGHLIFALTGYFVYHDLLWVFNKIPYASLTQKYGSGPFLHFIFQLNYVIGIPLYLLLVSGLISYPWRYLKKKTALMNEEYILVVFGFLVFILAHSVFWYFGIFNSMGLKRVLLGVLPLICLIALRGFNFLTEELPAGQKHVKMIVGSLLILYVIVFPFTKNPAAINWNKDMSLTGEQKLAKGVAAFIKENPGAPGSRLLYFYPYLSETLKVDHFDSLRRVDLSIKGLDDLQQDDRVIWDNWFAVAEAHVTFEMLIKTPGLVREIDFSTKADGREVRFVVFRKE